MGTKRSWKTIGLSDSCRRFVYGTARWSAAGEGTDGSPQSLGGFATHVFERQGDGSLKLRLHTFN
jgi:ketosteroid isomerase-like protein